LVKLRRRLIIFNGIDIINKPPCIINLTGIALVPEGRRIFPNLTVYENLLMEAYKRKDKEK